MNLSEVKEVRKTIAPNSIIHGDCIEVMKFIPDKSIDCIICDLPFGITQCKWDTVIPFEPLWEQYQRIIKPNGAIVLFGSQPFTSALVMSNPKWFKYEWIWDKEFGSNFALAKSQPLKCHETILVFSMAKHQYYPQMWVAGFVTNYGHTKPRKSSLNCQGVSIRTERNSLDRFPKSTIKQHSQKRECNNTNRIHPTQKPIALLEYLIKTYTQENELILDNTAGSGSLAIAAINTKRNYICIEKDDHYFQVMQDRIANHDPIAPPPKKSKPRPVAEGQLSLF